MKSEHDQPASSPYYTRLKIEASNHDLLVRDDSSNMEHANGRSFKCNVISISAPSRPTIIITVLQFVSSSPITETRCGIGGTIDGCLMFNFFMQLYLSDERNYKWSFISDLFLMIACVLIIQFKLCKYVIQFLMSHCGRGSLNPLKMVDKFKCSFEKMRTMVLL